MTSFNTVLEVFRSLGILFSTDRVITSGFTNSQSSLVSSNARYQILQSPGSSKGHGGMQADQDTLKHLDKTIDDLVLLCVNEFTFFNENQYTVACAVISTARV